MVAENVAYQLQNFEEAEIDESPVKWCSVNHFQILSTWEAFGSQRI